MASHLKFLPRSSIELAVLSTPLRTFTSMPASDPASLVLGHCCREDALQQGARKKLYAPTLTIYNIILDCMSAYRAMSDPLTHSSCHFGWAIFAFCHVRTLVINGLSQLVDDPDLSSLTPK
jgi:hypothetical protein